MIEAVITCVNYADYLEQTLSFTKKFVDDIVVVTQPNDKRTQKVCDRLEVSYISTNIFTKNRAKFCKGAGINAGLETLKKTDWILHLDADILLYPDSITPKCFERLDKKNLYTVPRKQIIGSRELNLLQSKKLLDRPFVPNCWTKAGLLYTYGYFQAWHFPTCPYLYNDASLDASISDIRFNKKWVGPKRQLIPNVFVYHLEMSGDTMGINWKGRKSPIFK